MNYKIIQSRVLMEKKKNNKLFVGNDFCTQGFLKKRLVCHLLITSIEYFYI